MTREADTHAGADAQNNNSGKWATGLRTSRLLPVNAWLRIENNNNATDHNRVYIFHEIILRNALIKTETVFNLCGPLALFVRVFG